MARTSKRMGSDAKTSLASCHEPQVLRRNEEEPSDIRSDHSPFRDLRY
jgi:hypothetical protein